MQTGKGLLCVLPCALRDYGMLTMASRPAGEQRAYLHCGGVRLDNSSHIFCESMPEVEKTALLDVTVCSTTCRRSEKHWAAPGLLRVIDAEVWSRCIRLLGVLDGPGEGSDRKADEELRYSVSSRRLQLHLGLSSTVPYVRVDSQRTVLV